MPKCRTCGAEIAWVKMTTHGNMPVDSDSKEKRICILNHIGHVLDTYIPHWATCPNAKEWKGK